MIEVALSELLTENLAEEGSAGLVKLIKSDYPKRKLSELNFLLEKGLPTYLRAQHFRCERVKTLLSRNDPVLLSDCYIAPDFENRGNSYSVDELFDLVNSRSSALIVSGIAGSGKSAFLKFAFTKVLERGDSYYPVFFELRRLQSVKSGPNRLKRGILESIREFCPEFTSHLFDFGLKRGSFYLLLDGFDEIEPALRDEISEEVEYFATAYQDCQIIITSRPSSDLESWTTFERAQLTPFSREQATQYIRRLPYDEEQKSAFVNDLNDYLFEENRAFLSNPLLTAMMLVTYSSYGEIPTKRHVFYEKCFDALAREHDTLKGRYTRQLFSALELTKLEDLFTFFCVLSYRRRLFRFSRSAAIEIIAKSKKAASVRADESLVLRDLSESISILIQDGVDYEFVHRSFQEYFYAKFAVEDRKLSLKEKVDWLIAGPGSDDTIDMILEQDTAYFEEHYLLPELRQLEKELSSIDPLVQPASVLGKCFTALNAREPGPDEKGEGQPGLSLSIKEDTNRFFLMNLPLHPEYVAETDYHWREFWPDREAHKDCAGTLRKHHGGSLKIHHMNNDRLVELGFGLVALRRKESISAMVKLLNARSQDRDDVMLSAFESKLLGS